MFVGHLGVALAAKKVEPRLSLTALVAAAFGLDLLFFSLLVLGLEGVRIDPGNTAFTPLDFYDYPWSHSLAMSVLWGLAAGGLAYAALRSARAAVIVGGAVISHWVLDFATHRPDLPLWPGGPLEGLGLWHSIPGTIAVEGPIFAVAVVVYLRATAPRDARGTWGLWLLVAITSAAWLSGPFSPPPPSVAALAAVGLMLAVSMTAAAAWIERHRTTR